MTGLSQFRVYSVFIISLQIRSQSGHSGHYLSFCQKWWFWLNHFQNGMLASQRCRCRMLSSFDYIKCTTFHRFSWNIDKLTVLSKKAVILRVLTRGLNTEKSKIRETRSRAKTRDIKLGLMTKTRIYWLNTELMTFLGFDKTVILILVWEPFLRILSVLTIRV